MRARGEVVLASGRTSCDWETLFAAAAGRPWRLVVVCGPADLDRVTGLNRDGRARVLVEVPHAEHARLLAEADVYALVLREDLSSAGQVRLMSAVEAGVPLVASDVRALEGYVVPGETALTVSPGDAARLRAEIERLLADPAERRQLRDAALARAETWTYVEYFEAVRELAVAVLGGRSMQRS